MIADFDIHTISWLVSYATSNYQTEIYAVAGIVLMLYIVMLAEEGDLGELK